MSSQPRLLHRSLWINEACNRKSRHCAGLATSALLLSLGLLVLWAGKQSLIVVPLGSLPMTMELRVFAAPPPPVRAPEPISEHRKLLAEDPLPESLHLPDPPKLEPKPEPIPEPPKPEPQLERPKPEPVREKPKPAHKPVKKAEKKPQTDQKPVQGAPSGEKAETASIAPSNAAVGHASGTPTAKADRTGEILAALLHEVEARKQYPKHARRQGAEGLVTLKVRLDAQGTIVGCSLAKESGKSVLDIATRSLGEKLMGISIPAAKNGQPLEILVPVQYRLQ